MASRADFHLPSRPYPAYRQAAGNGSLIVSFPVMACGAMLSLQRPSQGLSLAPFGGRGALVRWLTLSGRNEVVPRHPLYSVVKIHVPVGVSRPEDMYIVEWIGFGQHTQTGYLWVAK